MAGFLTSVIEEFITGKGTLQQIGLLTPNPALFTFLLAFFGGLTAYATARTIYRATNKEMTAKYALISTISSPCQYLFKKAMTMVARTHLKQAPHQAIRSVKSASVQCEQYSGCGCR